MFWGCTPGRPPRAPQSLSPKLTTPTRVNLGERSHWPNLHRTLCNKLCLPNQQHDISKYISDIFLYIWSSHTDHHYILTDRLLFLPQGHRQNPHCMCLELGWNDKRIWILSILVRSSIITGIKILEFNFIFPPFCLNDLPLSAHLLSLKLPSSSEKCHFVKVKKFQN